MAQAPAQVPDVKSLSGKYFFRELFVASDTAQASSIAGTLSFDGAGSYSFQGQQLIGNGGPAAAAGNGTYTVSSNGSFTLNHDPLRAASTINGRIGNGALVASNTETANTVFDLLIAIPVPSQSITNASLKGNYWVATLEFPSGSISSVRDAFFPITANGSGGFGDVALSGEISGAGYVTQTASGSTYTLNSDGSGTTNFPAPASVDAASQLFTGTKNVYVSGDAGLFIGGGASAGGAGIVVGVRSASTPMDNTSLNGIYFGTGMNVFNGVTSAFVGAANSTPSNNSIVWSRRYLQSGNAAPLNISAVNNYNVTAAGNGTMLNDQLAVAGNGNFFIASGVQPFLSTGTFELIFGVKAPTYSGTGVFLNPIGVFNAATFAVGAPIAEGEIITVFGTGFATQTSIANKLPLTNNLSGTQVLINGTPAPVFSVTPSQASAIVPYGLTGSTATIAVSSANKPSNTVTVPVATTAPGVFTMTSNGLGSAAVLHADYSLVSSDNPARRGEIVQVFVTGLGAVNPAVTAGTAAPTNPLSLVTGPVAVFISGLQANITYQGLTPGLTGLYQLNVAIPAAASAGSVPLAIETADGFTDQANIVIAPN